MTRDIALGNGSLLVNIDHWLQVRDFYFPHPGQENHLLGHAHRIGVFEGEQLSWLNEDGWERHLSYLPDTMIAHSTARNAEMECSLVINDCVDCDKNVFLRKITLSNDAKKKRTFTLFFYHDFHMMGDGIGDTAGYDPVRNSVFHYRRSNYFHISAVRQGEHKSSMHQYSVGGSDSGQVIADAQDGALEGNSIAQGTVSSIFSVPVTLEPGEAQTLYYFICCGRNFGEVHAMHDDVLRTTPEKFFDETDACWRGFSARTAHLDFGDLSHAARTLFVRSLLVIRTQIDNRGAILAANDSDNQQFNRDTYSYVWPRDGALVALALQKAGYPELAEPFYRFCAQVIVRDGNVGHFLHKYNPDGTLGSSWHPWVKDGKPQLPIQEDETALPIIAFHDYHSRFNERKLLDELYPLLIKPAAEFLCRYRLANALPKESYDLWEERQGVLTFTCATVCGGLRAAAALAREVGDADAEKYEACASEVHAAIEAHLYDQDEQRFVRMIDERGEKSDLTIDSSLYATFAFCGFEARDERVDNTMRAIERALLVKTDVGGIARYEQDWYHRVKDDKGPGNPWFICTLWLAKWHIRKAEHRGELERARELIEWACEHALSTGIMPEQLHPQTGEALSVAPLTWSHAEYVDAALDYAAKYASFEKY